jgi:hypothetical protein
MYVSEGRVPGLDETLEKCKEDFRTIKKRYPLLTVRKIVRMVKKQYADRWHEIQPKPEVASSILDKMRIASTRK